MSEWQRIVNGCPVPVGQPNRKPFVICSMLIDCAMRNRMAAAFGSRQSGSPSNLRNKFILFERQKEKKRKRSTILIRVSFFFRLNFSLAGTGRRDRWGRWKPIFQFDDAFCSAGKLAF